jgi:predicted metalloendopeptidase
LKVRLLDASAPFLPARFEAAHFDYRDRALNGQPENEPRWKRGVALVNGALGEIVGRAYVERHFPESARARMRDMVERLCAAYRVRLLALEWLGEKTKEKALEKLGKFTAKIGYPDRWKDYSSLRIEANDLFGNVRRANLFAHAYQTAKLGHPVDRGEWGILPQTVNAYYSPSMNEIVFPAAILQAPFFDSEADDAVNYGAIGAIIGHELSHGFDDQGSKSDGDGILQDWWTLEDKTEFGARTAKLAEQFDAYEPLPGRRINGKLTLGENIADLAGLTIAFHAYQSAQSDADSNSRLFFHGWAQAWRTAIRDEALGVALATDPHSPAEYRVNGIVRNMPEFHSAFDVKEGDKLFLSEKERVRIW